MRITPSLCREHGMEGLLPRVHLKSFSTRKPFVAVWWGTRCWIWYDPFCILTRSKVKPIFSSIANKHSRSNGPKLAVEPAVPVIRNHMHKSRKYPSKSFHLRKLNKLKAHQPPVSQSTIQIPPRSQKSAHILRKIRWYPNPNFFNPAI